MSKASYPYPDDEFDAPSGDDSPRGVHRAPRSAWRRWWPFLAVIIVVPALVFAGVTYAAKNGYVSHLPGVPGSSASAGDDASDDAAADDGSADDGATAPAPSTPAPPPATQPPATTAPAAPVLSTKVSVVNAAGISGLAATASSKLQKAGFTAVSATNGSKSGTTTSTVFYASEDLAPTAKLVASTLGLTTVTQSADKSGGAITVLLVSKLPS
ncbi:LytR C-terminal domain-containing protein [Cellulomonas citrea]|uniref:LytR C-terminal domain-containing protein n=1 Tax=Cellulomonas citrea TaxID=1909423 RepID=UPI00135BFAA2|nr:LytR C-terminal domain-containing protein [Cellulomonas citrea]